MITSTSIFASSTASEASHGPAPERTSGAIDVGAQRFAQIAHIVRALTEGPQGDAEIVLGSHPAHSFSKFRVTS
jgi:hypothetical protein